MAMSAPLTTDLAVMAFAAVHGAVLTLARTDMPLWLSCWMAINRAFGNVAHVVIDFVRTVSWVKLTTRHSLKIPLNAGGNGDTLLGSSNPKSPHTMRAVHVHVATAKRHTERDIDRSRTVS